MSKDGDYGLRDELADKQIIDFTDEELIEAGFKGDGEFFLFADYAQYVPECVTTTISQIKARPSLLGFVTGLMVYCQKQDALNKISAAPSPGPVSPTTSDSSSNSSEVTITSDSALTLVGDDLISPFEQNSYYIGLCENDDDVPVLYYRTSLQKAPFPMPQPGDRSFKVANKTAHGPFDKVLTRSLWNDTVGPEIIRQVLEPGGIKYASLKAARFSSCDEEGKAKLGPIVVWLGTHPGTTTAERARDVSPAILRILSNHAVSGAEVEWYEARVERLAGPPFMSVVNEADPTYDYRRPYTSALSFPIAAERRAMDDAQGSTGIIFHENKTRGGTFSSRVFVTTNKHVLSRDDEMEKDYEYKGGGAPRQAVRLLSDRGYKQTVADTAAAVTSMLNEVLRLSQEVERLEKELLVAPADQQDGMKPGLERRKRDLVDMEARSRLLRTFLKVINTQWCKPESRICGHTDYAPAISHTVDTSRHTRDLGVVELIPAKISNVFMGNVVDLGRRWAPHELNKLFYPNSATPNVTKFPSDGLLKISGWVSKEEMVNPTDLDENNWPVFIVGKVGSTTDFTVGRYSDLDAFLCDSNGVRSQEAVIHNYSKCSGNFSAKGDSGALIWTGNRRRLAVLHSGEVKGLGRGVHITYGTPAWHVKQSIEVRYPKAVYDRETF